jgi:hypothetical protein
MDVESGQWGRLAVAAGLALLVAGEFFVGLYPQPLFDAVEEGTVAMMGVAQAAGTVGAPR